GGRLIVDELDHVAAKLVWRQGLEQAASGDQAAQPHGAAHLVAAEGVGIDTQSVEVDADVWSTLGAVADNQRIAPLAYHSRYPGDRVHRSQRVGDMAERHHTRPGTEHRGQHVEIDLPIRGELADPEPRPGRERRLLPSDEVGMMLHGGDDYLISRTDVRRAVRTTVRGGYEVQRLGRSAGENQ